MQASRFILVLFSSVALTIFCAQAGADVRTTAAEALPDPVMPILPVTSQATARFSAMLVDQCDTTAQCRAIHGNTATDCLNSRSNQSVCMCGNRACNETPPTAPPPTEQGDQCDTTSQCRTIYGNTATDCLNSQSDQSVCMCGNVACDDLVATPTPSPVPPPHTDQCDTTSQCRAIYGNSATDCLNSQSSQSICMCGTQRCDDTNPTPSPSPEPSAPPAAASCSVKGDLRQWHRVEILCRGYARNERNDSTFTDHRFDVTFSQGSTRLRVPGHFAADGNAADSGATQGDKWRAYFSPPSTGRWNYEVSLRAGQNIAISDNQNAGSPVVGINGKRGNFDVGASNASARDMRRRGLLQHMDGERYLRFLGDGSIFISGGMDSPENIFGYSEFDNTRKFNDAGSCKGILHDFDPHRNDWRNGDPTWRNGRGKSLIGLVNYIASTGVNAIYIMANTVRGDGCDAHPWSEYNARGDVKRFDVSKLDQWERVLGHMTAKGIMIHMMTQETENDQLLNNGNLGLERKLYYRELISRFGHHPALQWNLGEENTNTAAQQRAFSNYIKQVDPYDHPIMMHTYPREHNRYEALLGHPTFNGPSIQFGGIPESTNGSSVYGTAVNWLTRSTNAGRPWVVTFTEASGGDAPTPNTSVTRRQRVYWMWAGVMAGGGGFEWYLKNNGAGHAYDLAVENLREFDAHWKQSGHLVKFFRDILQDDLDIDLQSLQRQNNITSTGSDWVLADPGSAYVIFLRNGGSTSIDLPNNTIYQVRWFNPRNGQLSRGDMLQGPGAQGIGNPPSQSNQDWAVVVSREGNTGPELHPDIVRVADIPLADIVSAPRSGWKDSYSVGDQCYCDSSFDHNIGDVMVNTPAGTMTVRQACDMVGPGPGAAGRPVYNDVQCGNGPPNDAGDEDYCPGRVDISKPGCTHIGPTWKISDGGRAQYRQVDGLVIMEAENTQSDLDLWDRRSTIGGHSGSGYLEFAGNNPQSGPARSPLEYTFTVNRSGLHYLHLFAAKEHLTLNGELRTDVANDGYVRLEGNFGAGPNAGNNHQDDAPLSALRSNTKFFGGSNNRFAWASGARLDLGGHNNKRVAVYDLNAGETYTLVLSGRSKFFKVDRIVFRHAAVSRSNAEDLSRDETRN